MRVLGRGLRQSIALTMSELNAHSLTNGSSKRVGRNARYCGPLSLAIETTPTINPSLAHPSVTEHAVRRFPPKVLYIVEVFDFAEAELDFDWLLDLACVPCRVAVFEAAWVPIVLCTVRLLALF
jgi:hypothetical protein